MAYAVHWAMMPSRSSYDAHPGKLSKIAEFLVLSGSVFGLMLLVGVVLHVIDEIKERKEK